jgi:rubrerythrin
LLTGKEDLLQSLIEAYLMEKATREFYSKASEKMINLSAKKIFHELSLWEGKHMDFIQFLYQSVQDDRDIIGFEDFKNKVSAPITEAGISVKDLEARMEEYDFTDESMALTVANDIEKKAYELYKGLSEKAVDTNARVVFRGMMNEEKKHMDYLKKIKLSGR